MDRQQDQTIVITGLAAVSPVGLNVKQTCASIRAGISRTQAHPYFFLQLPEPPLSEPELAIAAFVPSVDPDLALPDRLLKLALAPMVDLVESAQLRRNDFLSTGIFVCLPDGDRSKQYAGYGEAFGGEYLRRLGIKPGPLLKVYQEGHGATLCGLKDASEALISGSCQFAIVVSADSYVDYESLKWLDESYRLKSARNVDGFIPGESAVVLLFETLPHARARDASILAQIEGLGTGLEPDNIWSDKASSGIGHSIALGQLFNNDEMQIAWLICDLNGESYRSREWGIMLCRSRNRFEGLKAVWHPADVIGDVGAASGGIHIAMVCKAFERDYAPSDKALILCSSDNGKRSACLVGRSN